MSKYINPFTDWGFKQIFGQEANKDILLFFLNSLLEGERCITDLKFLDKELLGDSIIDRSLIYDVYCETDTGEHIIVEMQNREQSYFIDRSLYYLSKSIVRQGQRGSDWKYHIDAVYGVFFMNFTLEEKLEQKLRTDVILSDRETGKLISDKLRMIFLQLPYFDKSETECENDFERMIYVLRKMEVLNRMPFEKRSFIFEKLAKIAEVRKLTPEEQNQYDQSLKAYRDTYSVMSTAEEKGREKGREEGRAEGRAEERRSMASKLKAAGTPIDLIAQVSGLSAEEVEKL